MGFFDNVMSSDCYGQEDSSYTNRLFEERQREELRRQEELRREEERRDMDKYMERLKAESRGCF